MKTLKKYVDEQNLYRMSDMDVILHYLDENDLAEEAVDLITKLLKSKIRQKETTLQYARAWMPLLFLNNGCNRTKTFPGCDPVTPDEQDLFNLLTSYYLLNFEPSEQLLDKARKVFPNRRRPAFIFAPMLEWLKKNWGIAFKDANV